MLVVKVIALLPARSALTVILSEVSNANEVEGSRTASKRSLARLVAGEGKRRGGCMFLQPPRRAGEGAAGDAIPSPQAMLSWVFLFASRSRCCRSDSVACSSAVRGWSPSADLTGAILERRPALP